MTMPSNTLWTAKEAARVAEGEARGAWTATGISIDSRTLAPGDLFIALEGVRTDGHNYVAAALKQGAAAAMVSRIPEGIPEDAPLLIVDDTLRAMEDLGKAARYRCGGTIIGITGSVGKTGTKEMLAATFAAYGETHASKASHNNHWGVPLSLSGMPEGADYGVFEMGMNHAGEISPLSRMVQPDIAIITTIAAVHIENFDNVEGIANAKSEIFDGMAAGGTAILNRDNEWFAHLKARAQTRGLNILSFGVHEEADARMTNCLEAANGTRFEADIAGTTVSVALPLAGKHHALNALSVLLAVHAAGQDVTRACEALKAIEAGAGRGHRETIDIGDPDNPVTLIDESYNASPVAMRAAFKVLAMVDPGRGGRRIAFLGDMRELGKSARREHEALALPLEAAGVNLVYTCGRDMKHLYDALPQDRRGAHTEESDEMAKIVPDVLVPGDVVMVKGSRGGGEVPRMKVIVEALRSLPNRIKTNGGSYQPQQPAK